MNIHDLSAAVLRQRDWRLLSFLSSSSQFTTRTDNIAVVTTMMSILQHNQCGLYLVLEPSGNNQILVNGLTGENYTVPRSEAMVAARVFYKLCFTKSGMAFLAGGDGKLWVSGMKLKNTAVCDSNGRVAIQNTITNEKHWSDNPDVIKDRVSRTIQVTSNWSLVCTGFKYERFILTSRLGLTPHSIGANVCWEFRRLKEGLVIDYGKDNDNLENTWVKRNYHNAFAQWDKLFQMGGGNHSGYHWFLSEKAWNTQQAMFWYVLQLDLNHLKFQVCYFAVNRFTSVC